MTGGISGKVKALFTEIKTHWDTPAAGKYVPYKEYKDIVIAAGTNYMGSKTLDYIAFASSCFLIMYHYKLPYLTFSVITIINMPLGYLWTLLSWLVSDNLGFLERKTERLLYALYFSLVAIGLLLIIGDASAMLDPTSRFVMYMNSLEGISCASAFKIFGTHLLYTGWVGARSIFWKKRLIPKYGRYKYSLYSDFLPKCLMVILIGWLPFYNIPDVVTRVWVANLLFACYYVFNFDNQLEICTRSISPNVRERILVRSYPVKLSHIFYSILAIILPVVIGMLRYKWADINVYRFVIPAAFIISASLTMVFAGRVIERIPQPPLSKKVQIRFWDGLFDVMRNKYKWIQTIVRLLDSLGNGMLPFATILYLYTFRLNGLLYSLILALVSFAGTPPDLFAPYFLRRFTYKQIMIFSLVARVVGNSIIVFSLLFLGDRLMLCGTICVVTLIFLEICKTVPITASYDMDVRINDYQMYLSGERLESFSGVFGWFIEPITSFVGLIIPLLLLRYGFNSNWDVLFIDASRIKIIVTPIIIDVIGYVLMTIPYLFWDFDDNKHRLVMEVLRRREEVTARQLMAERELLTEKKLAAERKLRDEQSQTDETEATV